MLTDLRRQTPEECLSDLQLDEWLAQESLADDAAEFTDHVRTCERCAARLRRREQARESFDIAPPWQAAASAQQDDHASKSAARSPALARASKRWALGSAVASGLAIAAGLLLLVQPESEEPGVIRLKGGESLGFYVKHGAQVREGAHGEVVYAGDQLRFFVTTQAPRFVLILSRDAAGAISTYYSATDNPQPVAAGVKVPLATSIELDATLGEEEIVGWLCGAPPNTGQLRRQLEQGKGTKADGCTDVTLSVIKRATPGPAPKRGGN